MKPSIPKGTRDFSPVETARRNYIFDTIRTVFKLYGFQPLETPAMENLSTLTGKYGEEGDQLIFKILPRGEKIQKMIDAVDNIKRFISNQSEGSVEKKINPKVLVSLANQVSEEALRYDLTVPFARYVVMHQHEITFPFKRYQIQPVWRADKPQKGRYREFFQCDADMIGSKSLLNEVELVQMTLDVFKRLNIGVTIKVNNRKILSGIAEVIGEADKIIDITVAIDKLDKIGPDKVAEELRVKGVSDSAIDKLRPIIDFKGNRIDKLNFLHSYLSSSEIGMNGIKEVIEVFNHFDKSLFEQNTIELDITLARGLNYYTGAIFEVKVNDTRSTFTGSISGGGRYDDLTGMFGLPNMSGVGISYGADRIYDVMSELGLFPEETEVGTKVLFINFGEHEIKESMHLLSELRKAGIASEIYPDAAKMKKQMEYADKKKIAYVVMVGSNEIANNTAVLKNMTTGNQQEIKQDELVKHMI